MRDRDDPYENPHRTRMRGIADLAVRPNMTLVAMPQPLEFSTAEAREVCVALRLTCPAYVEMHARLWTRHFAGVVVVSTSARKGEKSAGNSPR